MIKHDQKRILSPSDIVLNTSDTTDTANTTDRVQATEPSKFVGQQFMLSQATVGIATAWDCLPVLIPCMTKRKPFTSYNGVYIEMEMIYAFLKILVGGFTSNIQTECGRHSNHTNVLILSSDVALYIFSCLRLSACMYSFTRSNMTKTNTPSLPAVSVLK